jgi:hypothetical protein
MTGRAIFSARDGQVVFEGRPLSFHRAIALRQRLSSIALDRSAPEPRANAFWRVATDLRAALAEAREQRAAAFHPQPPFAA